MRAALGYLWRHNRAAVLAFVAVGLITIVFGVRLVLFGVYWSDPTHRDQALQGWMTPRYIARSWDVPPEVVTEALDLAPVPAQRRTLQELATERAVPLPALTDAVMAALQTYRTEAPRP